MWLISELLISFVNTEITICITTYNRPELLKESLKSVLNQSYKNFRVIIGNDFIDQKITFESLELEFDERIKIINHNENLGEIANGNFMLNLCETEWFCYLSDDDLLHPSFLEELILIKEKENGVTAIFPNFFIGKSVEKNFYLKTKNKYECFFESNVFIKEYLTNKITLIGCYGLINTQVLKKVGGLPILSNDENIYSDFVLPIMLCRHGKIGWTNQKLVFNRVHGQSRSINTTFSNLIQSQDNVYEMVNSAMNELRLTRKECELVNFELFKRFAADQIFNLSKDSKISFIDFIKTFIYRQLLIVVPKISINLKFIYIIKVKILLLKGIIRRLRSLAFSRLL